MWPVWALLAPGGGLFLAVQGRDLAQLQGSEAQAACPGTLRPPGKEGISVPIWGLSTLFALQGSLPPKETREIFP